MEVAQSARPNGRKPIHRNWPLRDLATSSFSRTGSGGKRCSEFGCRFLGPGPTQREWKVPCRTFTARVPLRHQKANPVITTHQDVRVHGLITAVIADPRFPTIVTPLELENVRQALGIGEATIRPVEPVLAGNKIIVSCRHPEMHVMVGTGCKARL